MVKLINITCSATQPRPVIDAFTLLGKTVNGIISVTELSLLVILNSLESVLVVIETTTFGSSL